MPVSIARRSVDLGEDHVDDAVEDLALVGHVVVDRHRLDAELLREGADRQGGQAAGVGDGHSAEQDPFAAQRGPSLAAVSGWLVHSAPSSSSLSCLYVNLAYLVRGVWAC